MIKLYFCFPYRGVGGVALLFLRLAEYLAKEGMAQCHLVDYADGFMAQNRQVPGVELEVYEDSGVFVDIPVDAVAVFQSMTPWSIFPSLRFSASTRCLFWNCYPFNLVPLLPGIRRSMQRSLPFSKFILSTLLRSYRDKMRRFVNVIHAKRALVFMDSTNLTTSEQYLGMRIQFPEFLPIPAIQPKSIMPRGARDFCKDGLRFVWIGRLVDFKYYVLLRSLQDLDLLQPMLGLPILVKIVGSGNYSGHLHQEALGLCNLRVEFVEHISPDTLDEFLLQHADVLLAMGTSALEGAKLGVPTILLDVAHAPVPTGYIYQWLHQRNGYTLGDVLGDSNIEVGNQSLALCVDEILSDYEGVASRAREYFQNNHEISRVASKFMRHAESTFCTYGELAEMGLLKRGRLYRVFSQLRKWLSGL